MIVRIWLGLALFTWCELENKFAYSENIPYKKMPCMRKGARAQKRIFRLKRYVGEMKSDEK
ncbi:MAG: hypothetical protein D3925_06495 [Candidatus Electrothrix sp. AR5]|nr:hypothetical protein [Candidatus Electrothrix sp. AR5]